MYNKTINFRSNFFRSTILKASELYPRSILGKLRKIIFGFVFAVVISMLGFSNVPQVNASSHITLSFEEKPIVIEHGVFIRYTNPDGPLASGPNGNGVTDTKIATLEAPSGTITVTLTEYGDSGNFMSRSIEFTASPDGLPLEPTGIPPIEVDVDPGNTISVTVDGLVDETTIVASSSGTQLWANRRYDTAWQSCTDVDQDGICDAWEDGSLGPAGLNINYPGGAVYYRLACNPGLLDDCPGTDKKDIYLEIDYMDNHRPNAQAIAEVIAAFANAPVGPGSGIRLHIQTDDNDSQFIPHAADTPFPGANTATAFGFDQIKAKFYGTETERGDPNWLTWGWKQKKQVFHYALFVHERRGFVGTSGVSEIYGNDLMISLGSFAGHVGSKDEQAGTLMHELGHNLKLDHGGPWPQTTFPTSTINCKPNYLSVMSYARQTPDLVYDRQLDYSRKQLGTSVAGSISLFESDLNENNGVGSYSPNDEQHVVYGSSPPGPSTPPLILPYTGIVSPFDGRVNWNQNTIDTDIGITVNLNQIVSPYTGLVVCSSTASNEELRGYEDWTNIRLDSRGTGSWADGVGSGPTGAGAPSGGAYGSGNSGSASGASSGVALQVLNQARDRVYANPAGDLTKDKVIAMRVVNIDKIQLAIENLNSRYLADDRHDDASSSKNQLITILDQTRKLLRTGADENLKEASVKLKEFRGKIDGKGDDDLIVDSIVQSIFLEATDANLASYDKALDYEPTHIPTPDKHPPVEQCDVLNAMLGGKTYPIGYCITEGTVSDGFLDVEAKSLIVKIDSIGDGSITLHIPKSTLNAAVEGHDDHFFVLVDGEESDFSETETTSTERTLEIPFTDETTEIEIIGTQIVPEFGPIAALVLAIAIISIIALSKRTRFTFSGTS